MPYSLDIHYHYENFLLSLTLRAIIIFGVSQGPLNGCVSQGKVATFLGMVDNFTTTYVKFCKKIIKIILYLIELFKNRKGIAFLNMGHSSVNLMYAYNVLNCDMTEFNRVSQTRYFTCCLLAASLH